MASNPIPPNGSSANVVPIGVVDSAGNPYFKAAVSDTKAPGGGSGGGDPMIDIGRLQTHIRWIERGMVALGICLLALAGVVWHGYDAMTGQITNVSVSQQMGLGKIDVLDAKLSGKLDVIGQRLDDRSGKISSR